MIRYVPLESPPDRLDIPADLSERFWYDGSGKRLALEGPMYKTVYDRLRVLSQDRDYLVALDQLFRISVPDHAAEESRGPRRLVVTVIVRHDCRGGYRGNRGRIWFRGLTLRDKGGRGSRT